MAIVRTHGWSSACDSIASNDKFLYARLGLPTAQPSPVQEGEIELGKLGTMLILTSVGNGMAFFSPLPIRMKRHLKAKRRHVCANEQVEGGYVLSEHRQKRLSRAHSMALADGTLPLIMKFA